MPSSELSTSSQLEILDSAEAVPETANIVSLAQELLVGTDLATGGAILLRLAQIHLRKASILIDGWQQQGDEFDTVFDDIEFTDFDDFGLPVVGHVEINLDDLLLPIEHNYPAERQSASWVDTSLSSEQMQEQVLSLAHHEDIPGWSKRIYAVLAGRDSAISLPELQACTGLSLVETWLGLFLGGLEVSIEQQSDDFYSPDGIVISF
jgi:hypothetical protein